MLGRGNSVAAGRIQDNDAAARGCLNVDIVHANTSATDDPQLISEIQNRRRNFRLAANDDGTELWDNFAQLRLT